MCSTGQRKDRRPGKYAGFRDLTRHRRGNRTGHWMNRPVYLPGWTGLDDPQTLASMTVLSEVAKSGSVRMSPDSPVQWLKYMLC